MSVRVAILWNTKCIIENYSRKRVKTTSDSNKFEATVFLKLMIVIRAYCRINSQTYKETIWNNDNMTAAAREIL